MGCKMPSVVALAVLIALIGCSGGQDYSEVVEINTKYVDAMESYINDVENAENAGDVANAVEAYAQKMEDLAPQLKAIAAKHPEWNDTEKVPEELKPIQEKAQQMASQLPKTFMKTMQYITDAQVREAHKRLQESMAKMR
jgi:uncharacterized lipoprotein NlpE involved in copper resistance